MKMRAVRLLGTLAVVLLLVIGVWFAPAAVSVAPSYSPPASIPADCSADAQPELAAWLATIPDHSVVLFPAGSCYRLDTGLTVRGRNGLDFEGAGATLRHGTTFPNCSGTAFGASVLTIRDSNDVRVSTLRLEGTNQAPGRFNATYYCQHGFNVIDSNRTTLVNVEVLNPWGDCQYAGSSTFDGPGSNDTYVYAMDCSGAGREGSGLVRGSGIHIYGSTFTNIGRWGFSADANSSRDVYTDIDFVGNSVEARVGTFNATSGGGEVAEARVIGNTCLTYQCVIYFRGVTGNWAHDALIAGNRTNVITNSPRSIWLVRARNVVVSGNITPCPPLPNGGRAFLTVGSVDVAAVTNNVIANCIEALYTDTAITNLVLYGNAS